MSKLSITLTKSYIGKKEQHRKTAQALGLKSVGQTVVKEDNEAIRGMIRNIDFMVNVQEVE